MDCQHASEHMEDFRNNILDEPTRRHLEDHLGECEPCRSRLARLDRLDSQLHAAMKKFPVPDDFPTRIAAAIQKETIDRTEPVRLFWLRQAARPAACLLTLLAFVQFRSGSKPGVSTVQAPAPQTTERPSFEPGPADHGIGRPFVITDRGRIPYAGKTRVMISWMIHGTPQLTVEAFPN